MENLSYEKLTLFSKINCFRNLFVSENFFSMNSFCLIQWNWVKKNRKVLHILQKKTAFCRNFKKSNFTRGHLSIFPLTPKLLRAPKQSWCHFEALECSFHLSQENFHSFYQLTLNQQNGAFPNLWGTLYIRICKKLLFED